MSVAEETRPQETALRLTEPGSPNALTELGEKIFLDRYALKDMTKRSLAEGDIVVVCVDQNTGQREIGRVTAMSGGKVTVQLRDGSVTERAIEHVDKPLETRPEQMIARVARGIAEIETDREKRAFWETEFRWLIDGWKFLPGGRILTAAGTDQNLTYYNCYVIPSPTDSRRGIVDTLSQMMEIMSRGGGVGINVSSLRPKHAYVKGVNGRSSGSVSWGALYSFVTGLIEQGGSRRGALMLILNCWHPDVTEFINSKRTMGRITNANISVGITDDFMAAVEANADWDLIFPDTSVPDYESTWDGNLDAWRAKGLPVITHKTVKARQLWDQIIESAWASAEPGVFFMDRANKYSNSWYFSPLMCTNPCGEQPLPAWGICNLGAINLAKFVRGTQVGEGEVDWEGLRRAVRAGVRFLDNVIDSTPYFFEENERQQQGERRVGLGTMGLAEMLVRLGIRYGSPESIEFLERLYKFIATESYLASADNAAEKGAFPMFDAEKLLQSGYMKGMPQNVRKAVREKGLRNVTLLTQAPTGTTGTMSNTSTGIEPFFFWTFFRKGRLGVHEENVAVVQEWKDQNGADQPLPDYFVTAMDLAPEEHVRVQGAIQRWVDSAISKTANLPSDYSVEQTRELYELMYRLGCKGGTVYRDGSRDEQVLNLKKDEQEKQDEEKASAKSAALQPKVRPRPYKRYGVTVSKPTPSGTTHITMNDDDSGQPFEVFVGIGKGGSDVMAMAEGLGRIMSLVLRLNSPLTPLERVQEIVGQLKGIGGARSLGFGPSRVRSLPDAVSQALEEHYRVGEEDPAPTYAEAAPSATVHRMEATAPVFPNGNGHKTTHVPVDICPQCGEASFIHEEGCMKCHSCGHSEC